MKFTQTSEVNRTDFYSNQSNISISFFGNMQNAEGRNVDLYIPRKCSWTNRILAANDFGSVQINVADIDPDTGVFTKTYKTFAVCGYIRSQAESDEAVSTLAKKADMTISS